jgi:hypothetical protein
MIPAPEALRALARKYHVMGTLRAAGAGDETPDERAALRQIAAEFPGALRELDTLPTDVIAAREHALEAAATSGIVEPWMSWMHGYHALMRAALALKRRYGKTTPVDPEALQAIARAAGVPLDDAFVHAVASPPSGRLMAVVFDRLSAEFGISRKLIWDTLFPARKGERGYRQH